MVMATHVKKAVIYRMVMKEHICPFGLKSLDLLQREGYRVEDHWLRTREETDRFQAAQDVDTTPQTFIDGRRVGGYDDLRNFFGDPLEDPDATSYVPVLAVFAMTASMAIAAGYAAGTLASFRTVEWFVAFSMCVLAILKLRDLESFTNMFLGYDLLARRWVRYASIRRSFRGRADDRRRDVGPDSLAGRICHRHNRRLGSIQGGLRREARVEVRLRRWRQQRSPGIHIPDRKPDDGRNGHLDDNQGSFDMSENQDKTTDGQNEPEANHDIASLRRQYGVSKHEARRLIERFGNSRGELDLLLAGRGRTAVHRRREVGTPESDAAFGIG